MPNIYHDSPFYERDNIVKNYFKLLAIPGRYAQASEFSEIQSILLDCIKSIGDSLFNDGNVQSGCDIVIDGRTLIITPGRIYLDGIVRDTKEATLKIEGVGTEVITAKLVESLISEADDPSLLDPATTSSSAFQPGCYRVKQEVVFEINGDGYAVATLVDGTLQNFIVEKPQMDVINEVLARRTFAESGNYVVDGFNMKVMDFPTDDSLLVGLEKGQAFVKGFEVYKPTDSTFKVDKALMTRDVVGEPKIFDTSNTSYALINNPISKIDRVFVTLSHQETLVYNNLISEYDLNKTPVADIQSVQDTSTTYTKGVDYKVANNKIVWLSNKKPTSGTNFTVKYTYKNSLVVNSDYRIVEDNGVTYVAIINSNLLNNSEILIDYSYYLARKDTICIDQDGSPIVIKGVDDDLDKCYAPRLYDNSYLPIGSVLIHPNSNIYQVFNNTIRVSTMQRIQNAIERLDNLEYNITMTTLDQEILAQENSEQLRGLFTESFVSFDRVDLTMDDISFSLDNVNGRIIPNATETSHNLLLANNPNNKYGVIGDVYTLPYVNKIKLSQDKATKLMLVNPYQAFDPIMTIDITPSIDSWVNEVVTTDTHVSVKTVSHTWWSSMPSQRPEDVNTGTSRKIVSETASLYMRSKLIKVTSKTFPVTSTNVKCLFNGIHVNLTPINTTQKGTSAGSVKPDSNGLIEATFTVPDKVPCGVAEVELYDNNLRGFAQYRATGIDRKIAETIFITRVEHKYIDPLAQSFSFNSNTVLTGVDIYFGAKDSESVTVQVRNMEAGMPGRIVYSEVSLDASKIKISDKGSVATHFDFPNVVQCDKDEQYCIIVMTTSPKLSAFVAELGEQTLDNAQYVTSNPYTTGVVFSSSNASTWTPHQSMDLKFNLYGAEFEAYGELNFSNITIDSADRLIYCIDTLRGVATELEVYANINNTGYILVEPWVIYDLDSHAKSCDIRVVLRTSDNNQTPYVNKDSSQIISFNSDNKIIYISKNIFLDTSCQELKVLLNVSSHSSTSTRVWYAIDGIGSTWIELTSPKSNIVNTTTKQLEYFCDNLNLDQFRIKIEASTTNTCHKPFVSKVGVIFNESL